MQIIIFYFWKYNIYFLSFFFLLFSYSLLESVAKQRINSGFYLFEAEMKKKKEKKQMKSLKAKECRKLKDFMVSSDEDFY